VSGVRGPLAIAGGRSRSRSTRSRSTGGFFEKPTSLLDDTALSSGTPIVFIGPWGSARGSASRFEIPPYLKCAQRDHCHQHRAVIAQVGRSQIRAGLLDLGVTAYRIQYLDRGLQPQGRRGVLFGNRSFVEARLCADHRLLAQSHHPNPRAAGAKHPCRISHDPWFVMDSGSTTEELGTLVLWILSPGSDIVLSGRTVSDAQSKVEGTNLNVYCTKN